MKTFRADRDGKHRGSFEKNKKRIYSTHTHCALCGNPVDYSLKYPHPLSACIDHIIPIAKGGHPSDIDNLQLAHWTCNRNKSDKLYSQSQKGIKKTNTGALGNRVLPHSVDWINYKY